MAEDPAVSRFREYLRCNTMHPNPEYTSAVAFLKRQAAEIGLDCTIFNPVGDPVVIMTWNGSQPELPSLLLNSHMDVVPVFPEHWTHEPFSAHKTEDGKIYGRGSQDMKCVGMQHLETIRRLKAAGKTPLRTIHMSFVPDEEVGGHRGMRAMLEKDDLKPFNVGFVLDEGLASGEDNPIVPVYYAERNIWEFDVHCPGDPGHGSRFVTNTAAEKFRRVVNSFLTYRDEQEAKLKNDPNLRLGDVTTINLTMVKGGVQYNVVPDELIASFDIRVTPQEKLANFEERMNSWIRDAGEGITVDFWQKGTDQTMTDITPESKWWNAFTDALRAKEIKFRPEIFPAGTDSRHLRAKGYSALGFSYMPQTPILLHDHNEYIDESVFLEGIRVFEEIIFRMANVPA